MEKKHSNPHRAPLAPRAVAAARSFLLLSRRAGAMRHDRQRWWRFGSFEGQRLPARTRMEVGCAVGHRAKKKRRRKKKRNGKKKTSLLSLLCLFLSHLLFLTSFSLSFSLEQQQQQTDRMPPKKKSSAASAAAAKAASIAAGKRKVGETTMTAADARAARASGRNAAPAPPPPANESNKSSKSNNSRKQKAPQRSRASDDDVAALAGNNQQNNNNNGAAPSSPSRPAATFKPPNAKGRKPPRAIPGAPPAPSGPLNVPKVSLKVELSTLGGAFVGRKALSVVVPADAALWDVRRSIDATCRLLNNGLSPPEAARMTLRTIDTIADNGRGGAGSSASASAAETMNEGPPLTLETVNNGKETYLASYSIVPCPGGVYTLEMRPTKASRAEEARRAGKAAGKRARRSFEGGEAGEDELAALAAGGGGAPGGPRGRGRPRSAHLNPSGRPRSARGGGGGPPAPPPIAEDGTRLHLDNGARKRIKWSADETSILIAGILRCGDGQWATIRKAHLALFESTGRTDVDLKDKWRNLKRMMRRDGSVPGLSQQHLATLRAAIAEEDSRGV